MSYSVHIFDVGHGDSILIQSPKGAIGIVDCCKQGSEIPVRDFLSANQVKRIEFIVLTHPHEDHYSGMLELLEFCDKNSIAINKFYDLGLNPTTLDLDFTSARNSTYFHDLMSLIYEWDKQGRIKVYLCPEGMNLIQEGGFSIKCLAPDSRTIRKVLTRKLNEPESELNHFINHLSIVLLVSGPDGSALLLADSFVGSQKHICGTYKFKKKIGLYKISHHGSKRSYHHKLMKLSRDSKRAKAAISTGCRYGTPAPEVMSHLSSLGISTYSTNYPDYAGVQSVETDIPGVSRTLNDALFSWTDSVAPPTVIKPYHGDISVELNSGRVVVRPSLNNPPL